MKKFTITFSNDEYQEIIDISKRLNISPTQYIRNVSLGNIPDINFLQNIGFIPLVRTIQKIKTSL